LGLLFKVRNQEQFKGTVVAVSFVLNSQEVSLDVESEMPLLWAIRDIAGLTGTKYACGKALCGACTVHIDGQPMRSCVVPVSAAEGKTVTTIEGLSEDGSHPVQVAWREFNVAQCGYCQSGQIMSAVALLERNPNPGNEDIDAAMSGNICRCGTYTRIRDAIHRAAEDQS
jgi:isoquinoline 1-oxidoreductase alpha subunit